MQNLKKVVLALGSNMGEPIENLRSAVAEISTFATVLKRSQIYKTEPVGYLDQDDFFNATILCETHLEPLQLLKKCKEIESQMGRVKSFRNAPRPIDIDIIFYEGESINTEVLQIPHPRWSERDFVLSPLSDIFNSTIQTIDFRCDLKIISSYQKKYNPISNL